MPTEKNLASLVINEVESTAVYEEMKRQGLLNDDELYLVVKIWFIPAVYMTLSSEQVVLILLMSGTRVKSNVSGEELKKNMRLLPRSLRILCLS